MPVSGCARGAGVAAAAAVLALLLLPAPLLQPPKLELPPLDPAAPAPPPAPAPALSLLDELSSHAEPLDLVFAIALLLLAFGVYLCELIQMKLMEKRIIKLSAAVAGSGARLRAWQAARRQAAGALRLVRDCTAEYDLLLYLLLRRASPAPQHAPPAAKPNQDLLI